ncbi:hypothetical protein WJX72_000808 [[Myrmecia] bisecta]|uniref:S1 motif domain-containing protein n=1 Tax=[Myrmecia] bisecta TaxID=41462 RepID=A0AAW1PCC5_9CHLO
MPVASISELTMRPCCRSRVPCSSPSVSSRAPGCGVLSRRSQLTACRLASSSRPRHSLSTLVAAVEDPPAQSTSGQDEAEEELNMDEMYKRFEQLLDKYDYSFKVGDKVDGHIFRVDAKGAFVDVGSKAPAYCSVEEVSVAKVDRATQVLESDTRREFEIVYVGRDTDIQLSLKQVEMQVLWQRIRQLKEEDITVMGKVVGSNRGGLTVETMGLQGFVPGSHLAGARVEDMEEHVGKTLELKFLEVDEERQRLVFSNRRASTQADMQGLNVGDVVEGVVQSVKPYGAFVDIGGVNGLLHISQISHDRIANVENVLSAGDKLKVMILTQDRERGRVSLSTKKLEPTPGDMLRDPALVYARAEEMAKSFKERVAQVQAQEAQ